VLLLIRPRLLSAAARMFGLTGRLLGRRAGQSPTNYHLGDS
jgi:hypothetical protein